MIIGRRPLGKKEPPCGETKTVNMGAGGAFPTNASFFVSARDSPGSRIRFLKHTHTSHIGYSMGNSRILSFLLFATTAILSMYISSPEPGGKKGGK